MHVFIIKWHPIYFMETQKVTGKWSATRSKEGFSFGLKLFFSSRTWLFNLFIKKYNEFFSNPEAENGRYQWLLFIKIVISCYFTLFSFLLRYLQAPQRHTPINCRRKTTRNIYPVGNHAFAYQTKHSTSVLQVVYIVLAKISVFSYYIIFSFNVIIWNCDSMWQFEKTC